MRDYTLKRMLQNDLTGTSIVKKGGIATHLATFVLGAITTVGTFYFLNERITDDNLAKLATVASYSTGEPPTTVWANAIDGIPDWQRQLFPGSATNKLLVNIDLNVCGIRQASNTEANYWEGEAARPSHHNN